MPDRQPAESPTRPRAVFFVDGANFYRRLLQAGVREPNRLDLRRVAAKLATPGRDVSEIRYYTGKVRPEGDRHLLGAQQRLLASLAKQGVVVRLGRLEKRTESNAPRR